MLRMISFSNLQYTYISLQKVYKNFRQIIPTHCNKCQFAANPGQFAANPGQFAANPCQFAANPGQFAANPGRERFSLLAPTLALLPVAPPPTGDGRCCRPAAPRSARSAPHHSASPFTGVAGEPAGPAGCQLQKAPSRPATSRISPSATWASVVRGSEGEPACFKPQPVVSTAEFSALYERCLASGLKARMFFSHAAGMQIVTVTCSLPTTSATDATVVRRRRRRRRHRRRVRAATTAGNSTDGAPPTCTANSAVAAPAGDDPTPPSPEVTTPPAKRTRKRRNEVELLRDVDGEGDLLLSPPSCLASPRSFPPSSPSRSEAFSTASFTASSTLLPPAPLENVPALPPTCPPAPPELPVSPPPAESAPADQPSQPSDSLPPPSNAPPPTNEPSSPPPQPSPSMPGLPTVPAPPPRLQHQHDWDLCHECREHYHQKSFFHCWFCHYK
jgi:hypothetical protein